MQDEYLFDGPAGAGTKLILAHGAGQGMDSSFMYEIAHRLAKPGGLQEER